MKICQFSVKEDFPLEWQGEHPVLCVAGRSLIDEAAAIMLASHGLAARVEAAEVLYTANLFRLETTGVGDRLFSLYGCRWPSSYALLRSTSSP